MEDTDPNAANEKATPAAEPVKPIEPKKRVDPSKLTAEEQMALYEEDLKETDRGHQPC